MGVSSETSESGVREPEKYVFTQCLTVVCPYVCVSVCLCLRVSVCRMSVYHRELYKVMDKTEPNIHDFLYITRRLDFITKSPFSPVVLKPLLTINLKCKKQ